MARWARARWRTAAWAFALALLASWPALADEAEPAPDEAEESASEEAAGDAEPEDGPWGRPVADVRLAGQQRIEPAAVLPLLSTKPGAALSRAAVREDIRTLWSQKFFADVKVDATPGPTGLVVTFIVREKPLVREVKVVGNTELDEDDLKKELEVKPFQILDPEVVRRTVKKLESKYADKGFFLAEVRSRVAQAAGENQVDVFFDVVEHAKVEVRRIAFLGNRALSEEELKGSIGTQEASLLSFLTSGGTYKDEVFQRDLLVIQSLYYNKGYINIRVGRPAVSLSADRRYISITIPLEEGEPYDFGELSLGGEFFGQEAQAKSLITVREGERFSSLELQKTLSALQDYFRDQGYANVQVQPQTAVDVAGKRVDLRFVATPGEKVQIERIEIVGNTKTRDKVIRRELRIAEGDIYSGNGIKVSKARVTALGFFEAVDITSRAGSRPNTLVLEVAVKEKATGTFQVGLGFSNQEPILLNANVSQNNALGWGSSASLMAQLSRLRRIFSLSYTDPYFLDTDWTFAFDLYNTLQIYGSLFDRRAFGGTLTGGYQIYEDMRVFATYTLQQVDVVPTTTQTVLLANRFRGGLTSSLKGSFNWDKRDNRLFPTRGFLLSGSVEIASPLLLSENVFERWVGITRLYYPIGRGFVAKLNATVGYIRSPVERPVPVSELFFEGGINSLRGYNFRSIAPTVYAGTQPGNPLQPLLVGGNKEFLSNWELEFPVLEEAGLRGVVFFDAGNVYAENQRLFDPDAQGKFGLLMSVGVGARWFTPLGPLRFEWGFPLTPRPNDQSSRFEFTIGNFF
jgi:outer membrane protein insertion porin family